MKLHCLSDLHTEFEDLIVPDRGADLIVLAGDIGVGLEGVGHSMATSRRLGRPVVYVPGNHEFYQNRNVLPTVEQDPYVDGIDTMVRLMKLKAEGSGVVVLDNAEFRMGDLRVLGTILWTDFQLFGPETIDRAMTRAAAVVNDFRGCIQHCARNFLPEDALDRHRRSLRWLIEMLHEPFEGVTVVVSHHAPSMKSVPPKFRQELATAAFASDLKHLIEDTDIELWIHGHTHYSVDYRIGKTRVVSNQRGYPYENVPCDPCFTVEL